MEKLLNKQSPFGKEFTSKSVGQGGEFDVKKLKWERDSVIKELRESDVTHLRLDPELSRLSFEEFARERYQKALTLMQENGFEKFLPRTKIVIGHRETTGEPTIYLIQERIKGPTIKTLETDESVGDISTEVINFLRDARYEFSNDEEFLEQAENYPRRILLEKLDELLFLSLRMWYATLHNENKSELPISVVLGGEIRRPHLDEGVLPEILNQQNTIIAPTGELYVVDTGLIAIPKDVILKDRGLFLLQVGWLACLYHISGGIKSSESLRHFWKNEDLFKKVQAVFTSKTREFLNSIEKT